MKFFAVASILFAGTLAVPTSQCGECERQHQPGSTNPGGNNPGGNNPGGVNPGGNSGGYEPCPPGLYSNPQCCAVNVLGVASLDCQNPTSAPTDPNNFSQVCGGKQPQCCVVPVAGQGVLCQPVPGTGNQGGNNQGGNNQGGNNQGGSNQGGSNQGGSNPGYQACPAGLYSNPQCCSTNVLGVAALDCANPSSSPTSGDNFQSTCSSAGKEPVCCVIPVAGQDVLCVPAIGGGNSGGSSPGGSSPGGRNPSGNTPSGNSPGRNPGNGSNPGNYKACQSGLYSNPQCCAANILGIAALDCENPSSQPTSKSNFQSSCNGKQPLCCVIPVAGQDVLCVEP